MDLPSTGWQDKFPALLCSPESLRANERIGALGITSIVPPEISSDDRAYLVDWLIETSKMFKLKPQSFFCAVNIMDAVLSRDATLIRTELQLCGIASLWLSAKYHEIYPPEVNDMVFIADNNYAAEQIREAERKIFKLLGCNINIAQEMSYHREMSTVCEAALNSHQMGKYLLYVLALRGSRFLPSVVISAVRLLMANIYQEKYVNYFEVPENYVNICMAEILFACRLARKGELKAYENIVIKRDKDEWARVFDLVCEAKSPQAKEFSELALLEYLRAGHFRSNLAIQLLDPSVIPKVSVKLGEGTFGIVKRVEYQGVMYAVKETIRVLEEEGIKPDFSREVSLMQSLNHPNIAKMRHVTSDLKRIFMDLGVSDLFVWIQKNGPAGKEMQMEIARQMFTALLYMHDMGCLHRDIKPQNIIVFLDDTTDGSAPFMRLVLSDLGAGRGGQVPIRMELFTREICTLQYRSPELLLGASAYDDGLDTWSMLCTLYECATGQILFHGNSEADQLRKIFRVLGTPDEQTWPDVSTLPDAKLILPEIPAAEAFFFDNDALSDCYKELLTLGLIMDPEQRPRSRALLAISWEYIS